MVNKVITSNAEEEVSAVTLRWKLKIKLAVSPSHGVTPGAGQGSH